MTPEQLAESFMNRVDMKRVGLSDRCALALAVELAEIIRQDRQRLIGMVQRRCCCERKHERCSWCRVAVQMEDKNG